MKRNVIAITGGIGSGKSVVAAYLRQKGFATIDCDVLSREVAQDALVLQKVAQLLGNDCVVDGKLNRPLIRKLVFANDQLHKQYSDLFNHQIEKRLLQLVNETDVTVFVEIPLFDAFPFQWDHVWLVQRPFEERVQSVVERDGVDRQNVLDIVSKQNECESFTVKLTNDGNLQQLYQQVDNALDVCGLL